MYKIISSTLLYVAASASVAILTAATPGIGVAISDGIIRINDSATAGNATVFNGTMLRTEQATRVRMNGGAQLQLGSASEARVFSDHIDLQQGGAEISGLSASANGLKIDPQTNSSASIRLRGGVVEIAALTGNVLVYNARGVSVANLLPGRALSLTPQDAGASAPSSMTGCIRKHDSVYTLTDETSNVTVQLRGDKFKAGRHVQVTGTTVAGATAGGGATQVLAVTGIKDVEGGCSSKAGMAAGTTAAAAGGTAAAAGVATGAAIGISTTTAIVAGVAAAAVAGTAAGVAATSSGSSTAACLSPCK
jgi:hypothetical protein